MQFGISTACLYPQTPEDAVEILGQMGVQLTEVFFNTYSEVKRDYVAELKKRLDFYGMETVACHPFTSGLEPMMFFSGYQRRLEDMLDQYRYYFEAMNQLGASVFVFHGDFKDSPRSVPQYAENFKRLCEAAKSYGITVAQENVARCRSGDVAFVREIRRELQDDIFFVLDTKQALRSGYRPEEVAEAMGDRIVHLHLSDSKVGQDCLLPSFGDYSFSRLFDLLTQHRYSGCGMIEVYQQSYSSVQDFSKALTFLNAI